MRFEHAFCEVDVIRGTQFQEGRVSATRRCNECTVVFHQTIGIRHLGEIREVKAASHRSGRTGSPSDHEGKLEAGMNIEQLSPVLERKTCLELGLLEIEPPDT